MPASNPFASNAIGPNSPAIDVDVVTPSDTTDQANVIRQIYAGVGGDITVVTTAGSVRLYKDVPQGSHIGPFKVVRVNAIGTTASSLIGYI